MTPKFNDSFASVVKSVGGMRSLVAAGMVTAAVATGFAGQALALENNRLEQIVSVQQGVTNPRLEQIVKHEEASPSVQQVVEVLNQEKAGHGLWEDYFVTGLKSIATADLKGMSPAESLRMLQKMASETLKGGPEHVDVSDLDVYMKRAGGIWINEENRIVDAHKATVRQVARVNDLINALDFMDLWQPVENYKNPEAGVAALQDYAKGMLKKVTGQDHGSLEPVNASDVLKAQLELLNTKLTTLIDTAYNAKQPDADLRAIVEEVQGAEQALHPAQKNYLEARTNHFKQALETTGAFPSVRDRIIAVTSLNVTADIALSRIDGEWRKNKDNASLDKIADLANQGIKAIEELDARHQGLRYDSIRYDLGMGP